MKVQEQRRRLLISMASSTAIVAVARSFYLTPHLQACALPLFPGSAVSSLLFYRDGGCSIPNAAFIAFETVLNLIIYALAVWITLPFVSRRRTQSMVPSLCVATAATILLLGCKSTPTPTQPPATTQPTPTATTSAYPPRPTAPSPPFKLFHHDDSSFTLVTDANATDDQIAAIIWQLHDAAHARTFDTLNIPQNLIDARAPIVWFHIYRGSKCASEKYTSGTLPCGPSYHAAGDYTLGGFSNHNHEQGALIHGDNQSTQLWDSETGAPNGPPAQPGSI
jgi:hypothetical protein